MTLDEIPAAPVVVTQPRSLERLEAAIVELSAVLHPDGRRLDTDHTPTAATGHWNGEPLNLGHAAVLCAHPGA
jgi:hypothetical protein